MASSTRSGPFTTGPRNTHKASGRSDRVASSGRCARSLDPAREAKDEAVDHLIEWQIVPRLLVAHKDDRAASGSARAAAIDLAEAEPFARLSLEHDADELLARVEAFIARGATPETVFIELLAPAARKLGEFWEEDICDFVDVTMGLWRLQEVMREIARAHPPVSIASGQQRSALFSPMPGDQHSFGALMVEECFARAGWDSEALIEPQRGELLKVVRDRAFDLVGLTVTGDCPSGDVASLVAGIRSVSKARNVKIMLGGRAVAADPALVDRAGADGTAADAPGALLTADTLVPLSANADYLEP